MGLLHKHLQNTIGKQHWVQTYLKRGLKNASVNNRKNASVNNRKNASVNNRKN